MILQCFVTLSAILLSVNSAAIKCLLVFTNIIMFTRENDFQTSIRNIANPQAIIPRVGLVEYILIDARSRV